MKVKNFAHKIGIILFIYFAFSVLVYISIAFVKAECNPFAWKWDDRLGMVFIIFCAACFAPAISFYTEIEEKNEN